MDTVEIVYKTNAYKFEIDQLNCELIRNVFGFSDENFALIDASNIVVRKMGGNKFNVSKERGPFKIVRSDASSSRTYRINNENYI